jgi:hypothetical protein
MDCPWINATGAPLVCPIAIFDGKDKEFMGLVAGN